MKTLGAKLKRVLQGIVEIIITPGPTTSQKHGFVQGAAVGAIADRLHITYLDYQFAEPVNKPGSIAEI